MFKNVWGPITENVLTYVRGKIPGGFANIAGTTACKQKLIYHTHTEPTRDRIFHTKQVTDFKWWETSLISMLLQEHLAKWRTFFCMILEKGPMEGNLKYR